MLSIAYINVIKLEIDLIRTDILLTGVKYLHYHIISLRR